MEVNILRVLLAKIGLDGHDKGLKIIAKALQNSGVEVIYLGLRQSVEKITEAAIEEDASAIGISSLSGTHITSAKKLIDALKKKNIKCKVFFGGVIPKEDVASLKNIGIDEVFPVGSNLDQLVNVIKNNNSVKAQENKNVTKGDINSNTQKKQEVQFYTDSKISIKEFYTNKDTAETENNKTEVPGEYPYTRGPYKSMYRDKLWTMRQYSGFGTAADSNERYKYLLGQGQTGLSVAFDLPTQLGYDSDNKEIEEEVGRVGVAIDTIEDMHTLFKDIPLDKVSVNFTINSTAIVILAMFIAVFEERGYDAKILSGTTQNEMIKEFISRNSYIFPIEPSIKIVGDIIEYSSRSLPKFNPISLTGYHIRELGANAIQELAITMSIAILYVEEAIKRGMDVDSFAPRLSFHFACNQDFFEEIAKFRAARRIWAKIMKNRFYAKNEKSCRLRFFSGGNGTSLTAQEPLNNIVRCALICLSGVLGGAQAIHVAGYDEALSIPTIESVNLSLRTQQVIAYESGVTKTVDPLAGSYYVESLTNELEEKASQLLEKIEKLGGIVECVKSGWISSEIINSAYNTQKEINSGRKVIVGVNKFIGVQKNEKKIKVEKFSLETLKNQKERLKKVKKERDNRKVRNALDEIRRVAENGNNLMPVVIKAVKARATIGEIINKMKTVFGECNNY